MASMLQNMTRLGIIPEQEGKEPQKPKPKPEPASIPIDTIYVSTSLEVLTPPDAGDRQDYLYKGTTYRRLDPVYFGWLRNRMLQAREAFNAGKIPEPKWKIMTGLFNAVQNWALEHFGPTKLTEGEIQLRKMKYTGPATPPPVKKESEAWKFPKTGNFEFTVPVSPESLEKVRAIKSEALALGWSESALFQNRGNLRYPVGNEYGLVCFLEPEKDIRSVSKDFVEIVHHEANQRETVLRFQNPALFSSQSKEM